jgi:hypothetical protein
VKVFGWVKFTYCLKSWEEGGGSGGGGGGIPTEELDARPDGGGPMTPTLAAVAVAIAPDMSSLAT